MDKTDKITISFGKGFSTTIKHEDTNEIIINGVIIYSRRHDVDEPLCIGGFTNLQDAINTLTKSLCNSETCMYCQAIKVVLSALADKKNNQSKISARIETLSNEKEKSK